MQGRALHRLFGIAPAGGPLARSSLSLTVSHGRSLSAAVSAVGCTFVAGWLPVGCRLVTLSLRLRWRLDARWKAGARPRTSEGATAAAKASSTVQVVFNPRTSIADLPLGAAAPKRVLSLQ